MKFQIEGTRTIHYQIIRIETISGDIAITKKQVMDATGCSAVEDGDSSAWKGYVAEALNSGADFTDAPDLRIEVHSETTWRTAEFDEDLEVDW